MSERVSVVQAARELGISPQGVRENMKKGLLDIGYVFPSVSGTKTLRYFIYRDKLNKHLGKEVT
ncbi:MAG: hypothetical protein K1W19_12840 [Lachnospiraceae bacterium]